MEGLKVQVSNNTLQVAKCPKCITSGTIGLKAEFTFDSQWDALAKMAVFQVGTMAKTVEVKEGTVVVPWEVLEKPYAQLRVGVYGVNADCTIAIPTVWGEVCVIEPGADPEADPAVDPTLPVWQDLLIRVEELEESGGGSGAAGKDGENGFSIYQYNGDFANTIAPAAEFVPEISDKPAPPLAFISEITIPDGRALQVGDFLLDSLGRLAIVDYVDLESCSYSYVMTIKGQAGKDGEDGFSPTVEVLHKVDESVQYKRITITDCNGSKSFLVYDGTPGRDGVDGIDGTDGTDGYTPVRGTDYWTPADIAEIKSYVDEAILGGAW